MIRVLLLLMLVPALALAAAPPAVRGPQFTEVGKAAGIEFTHTFGDRDLSSIVEDSGAGVGWIDYDRDGDEDLLFVNGTYRPDISKAPEGKVPAPTTCKLYRNDAGKFTDVTASVGLDEPIFGMGVTSGDYDADGWLDVYLTGYKGNRLYHNEQGKRFEDVTAKAGVALADSFCVGATFVDYDRDGKLDLFVGNYLQYDKDYKFFYPADRYPGPLAFNPLPDTLFRNNGDGTFTDVSKKTGIALQAGRSMGCTIMDVDEDGWPDIYVANDGSAKFLYMNHGGKYFQESAVPLGVAFGQGGEGTAAMGPDAADLDGDGFLDLFVPDDKYSSLYLYRSGKRVFEDRTAASGIAAAAAQFIGWGSGGYDLDNDGLPDLYQVNGDLNHLQPQEDLLFRGTGDGKFDETSLECGEYFSQKYQGRGAAFADYDGDGDIDVALVTLNGPGLLLRNDTPPGNHWTRFRMQSAKPSDPIGTRLWATAAGKRWRLAVRGGSGYASQSERTVHLGLGAAGELERLEVAWPSGRREAFEKLPADKVHTLVEGTGKELK